VDQYLSFGVASQIYKAVGPVGAVLLVLSVFSLALIIIKTVAMMFIGAARPRIVEQALAALENDGVEASLAALGDRRHPSFEMMRTAARLALEGRSPQLIQSEVRAVAAHRFAALSRYNRLLELIGLIAPLLGLLGTIIGMISAFQALQSSGAQADPAVLAGGIWEALLTTAIGLVVAIPAIVAFNLVENRIDSIRQQSASVMGRFFARLERRMS